MLLHFSSNYSEALKLTGSRSTSLLAVSLHPLVVVASYCSQKNNNITRIKNGIYLKMGFFFFEQQVWV